MSGQVLAGLSTDHLASRLVNRRSVRSGIAFARQKQRPAKSEDRNAIAALFTRRRWSKGLSIVTMPGLHWSFEKALLAVREGSHYRETGRPKNTYICALEADEYVYRAALKEMPGAPASLVQLATEAPATCTLRTYAIVRYQRCSLEEWVAQQTHHIDAAWLDFTGPLTTARLDALCALWPLTRHCLVVTVMKGRHRANISAAVKQTGGISGYLAAHLTGAEVIRQHSYRDSAPMLTLAFVKRTSEDEEVAA